MTAVHVVVPDGVDDPARPSGGNTYDRCVCGQLTRFGFSVHEHAVPEPWPRTSSDSFTALAGVMQRIPDGALALVDGLVASAAPEVLVPEAGRLRLVMLVHMPVGHRAADEAAADIRRREGVALRAAGAVVTTSQWCAGRLQELYQLAADRLHVATPGVLTAELAPGTADGGAFLCVAAVTFDKGHDVLVDALHTIAGLSWHCLCVGSLDREPEFVSGLRPRISDGGLEGRVRFAGPRTGSDLDRTYADADLVVLASRAETYGMVVTEALARGLPVVAAEVGGVAEAMGYGADGVRPGLLVAPEDAGALAASLRSWLGDAELRARLRRAASQRRASLSGWSTTASVLAGVLARASR